MTDRFVCMLSNDPKIELHVDKMNYILVEYNRNKKTGKWNPTGYKTFFPKFIHLLQHLITAKHMHCLQQGVDNINEAVTLYIKIAEEVGLKGNEAFLLIRDIDQSIVEARENVSVENHDDMSIVA